MKIFIDRIDLFASSEDSDLLDWSERELVTLTQSERSGMVDDIWHVTYFSHPLSFPDDISEDEMHEQIMQRLEDYYSPCDVYSWEISDPK